MTSISLVSKPTKSAFALRYSDSGFEAAAMDFAPSKEELAAYGAKATAAATAKVPGPAGSVLVVGANGLS